MPPLFLNIPMGIGSINPGQDHGDIGFLAAAGVSETAD
jgi:hypothetical protein